MRRHGPSNHIAHHDARPGSRRGGTTHDPVRYPGQDPRTRHVDRWRGGVLHHPVTCRFRQRLGIQLHGGMDSCQRPGVGRGGSFTLHPRPGTYSNRYGTMSYVGLRVGPRYTLNPQARTTPFIQLHALATRRSYSDRATSSHRSRLGGGGGGVIGVTGATSVVRVEFGVGLDYLRFADEKEGGVIVDEEFAPAFNGKQLSLTLSFLVPLSTR